MNWKQLYACATPEERLEVLIHMLVVSTARQKLHTLTVSHSAHYINNAHRASPRGVYISTFIFILLTLSIAVWISMFILPPIYAAPLMLLHITSLTAILLVKPYRRRSLI